jgi:hypothetical protein
MMLHRKHPEGTVVIAQPAHGVLVGAVARAWGASPFAVPPHMPQALLAAEQHEIGMAAWELAPTFNPVTGLPHAYTELTLCDHLTLWPDAAPLMWTQNRYAALLVSRHGAWIFAKYEGKPADPDDRAAVVAYLRRERAFQARVRASLAADPDYADAVTLPALARAHYTFTVWDRIAVHACYGVPMPHWGVPATYEWDRVPKTDGGVAALTITHAGQDHWTLDPWPLTVDELRLHGEGRLLRGSATDRDAMLSALDAAPWVSWESRITPVQ